MPRSHLCVSCGWDLAKIRATPDPAYGLLIVACPRCDTHAVKRRVHPTQEIVHWFLKLDLGVTMLGMQLIFLGLSILFAFGFLIEVPGNYVRFEVIVGAMCPLALWLHVGFPHHRLGVAPLIWIGAVLLPAAGLVAFFSWPGINAFGLHQDVEPGTLWALVRRMVVALAFAFILMWGPALLWRSSVNWGRRRRFRFRRARRQRLLQA